jgi:cobalt/nickel transport protein
MRPKLSGNWLLVIGVIGLSFGPLLALQGRQFGATDSNNSIAIQEIQPGYKPWFESVIKPSGTEVQTFLFAVQAGIGAGVMGYILGLCKGRSEQRKQQDESSD